MTLSAVVLLAGRLDPPLDPSGDEARSLLRRELADPKYYQDDPLQRITDWLGRLIDSTVENASSAGPVPTLVFVVVTLGLVAALALLLSRARRTARAQRPSAAALTDEVISADELRARAEAALAAGDASSALVDAFRAAAVRQVERARIEDLPQATAHELARALAAAHLAHGAAIHRGADLFDRTLYGERPATRAEALELLALDDTLAGRVARR